MTALCEILHIPRSTFYYNQQPIVTDAIAENAVIEVFKASRGVYGAQKIKATLLKQGIVLSRRRIGRTPHEVIVSDLTYVRVKSTWHYICILVDLFNREIVGYSAGPHKNAELVYTDFAKANISLGDIQLFHTDRGSEFKNGKIED